MRPIPGRGDCLEAIGGDGGGILVELGAEFGKSRVKDGSMSMSVLLGIGYSIERRCARDVEATNNLVSHQP
jgi:hypothetical protein